MKYIRDLSNVDRNVMSVSPQIDKSSRPFVGILILINQRKYCIPLTSPKAKFEGRKNSVDFIKILHPTEKNEHGANKVIGALNLNNMIPVEDSLLTPIDLNSHSSDNRSTILYKQLMKDQLNWCQSNHEIILKRANQLYNLVSNHPEKNRNLVKRCCNFKKLETALDRYIEKHFPVVSRTAHSSLPSKPRESVPKENPKKPFYIGRKAILGHKPSSKQQEPAKSQERNKHNHRNNNNLE